MTCLICDLIEVTPEAVAGLCVSCQSGIRRKWLYADTDVRGNVFIHITKATADNPLGWEGKLPPEPTLYDPRREYPHYSDSEVAAVTGQLIALSTASPYCCRNRAREAINAIRDTGCTLRIDTGSGLPTLSHPERLPYPLLLEFVRQMTWIEDLLSRERAAEIVQLEQNQVAQEAKRNGLPQAGRNSVHEYGNPTRTPNGLEVLSSE